MSNFESNMAAYFGMHVGNSSICLAICKDKDRVEVIANDVGDRITPAITQWTPNSCVVGKTAQVELFKYATNTIVRNKQLLEDDISSDDLEHFKSQIPYKINKLNSVIKYEVLIEGKQFHVTPRKISEWIFKKALSLAESAVGRNKEINVVVTVPLYFSQKTIQSIKEAAKKAGFNVLQVVDEPSTAALGYGLGIDQNVPLFYCLVYRVGGYSIDATVLMVHNGIFTVVHSVHKSCLGGILFTEKLSDYLASEFKRQYKTAEVSERGKYKLYAAAESIKQILSIQNVAQCSCESIGSGYDFNCSVSRARFENIIAPLIPDIIGPIMEVIEKSGLKIEDINKVVACGGTLKTPKLQETVRKVLPASEMLINSNPDEIIALGAAKQAGYLQGAKFGELPATLAIDSLALSSSLRLKVEQDEGVETQFTIHKNTLLPIRKQYSVSATGKNLTISLVDTNNINLRTTYLNNVESQDKITIDLDINKEGKVVVTIINGSNNERSDFKYDLNEKEKLLT